MTKGKRAKGQATIYKTLHRKLKIEQHEPHLKQRVDTGGLERSAVPAPHVNNRLNINGYQYNQPPILCQTSSSKHKITTEKDGYLFNQVNNLNIGKRWLFI